MKQKSDLSRAFSEDGALKTHVGGQALLEGIMMRGKYNWSVAVREPEGTIYLEEHDLASGKEKNGWLYWPFIRGCRAFVESLALGYKALSIAAEHAFVEEDEEEESRELETTKQLAEINESQVKISNEASVAEPPHEFSWKDDVGNPDEALEALGAQTTLEIVSEPKQEPASVAVKDKPKEKQPLLDDTRRTLPMQSFRGLSFGFLVWIRLPGRRSRTCRLPCAANESARSPWTCPLPYTCHRWSEARH